jgi:hypothetical protein
MRVATEEQARAAWARVAQQGIDELEARRERRRAQRKKRRRRDPE